MAKKNDKVNILGIDPRNLTLAQRRELFLKKKAELSKDWRVLQPGSVEKLLPFNRLALDHGLKLFGLAGGGTVYHLHGDEGSGKSTLACDIAMNYMQQTGEAVAYFDYERRLQSFYLRKMGANIEMMYILKPDSVEEGIQRAIELMNNGVRLFIYDSIPRMQSKVPVEDIMSGQAFKTTPGSHARSMEQFYRLMLPHLSGVDGTLIMINQTRSRIEMTREAAFAAKGMSTVTNLNYILPGGRANRFATSVMIENRLARAWRPGKHPDPFVFEETAQHDEQYIALEIKHRTLKNTITGTGYREATSYIRPGQGIDENISIRAYARAFHLIENHGKRWYVGESIDNPIKVYDDKASAIRALTIEQDPAVLKPLRELVQLAFLKNEAASKFDLDNDTARYLAGEDNDNEIEPEDELLEPTA